MKTKIKFQEMILIEQGEKEEYNFYLSKLSARKIIKFSNVIRLSEDPNKGVQRFLDKKRVRSIAKYCETESAIFPTPIILSLNSDFLINEGTTISVNTEQIFLEDFGKPFSIIDGQHRIEGIKKYYEKKIDVREKEFELPVIIYLDADQAKAASIFVTINANQRSVDSSIIHQLFGIIYENSNRYTVQSFSNQVTKILNEAENSSFHNSIKMLGKRQEDDQVISQGTIAKKITERITSNIDEDNLNIERGNELKKNKKKIFRDFFIDNDPVIVAKIMMNFFNSFSYVFPLIWEKDGYITRKAIGFSALMKLLDYVYNETKYLKEENFTDYFEQLKKVYYEKIKVLFISKASSESVANDMAKELINMFKESVKFKHEQ